MQNRSRVALASLLALGVVGGAGAAIANAANGGSPSGSSSAGSSTQSQSTPAQSTQSHADNCPKA